MLPLLRNPAPVPPPDGRPPRPSEEARAGRHWRAVLRLSAWTLAAWLLVTLGVSLWAVDVDASWWGWPFNFWLASQGALLLFLAIVIGYAWGMDRLDAAHRIDDRD